MFVQVFRKKNIIEVFGVDNNTHNKKSKNYAKTKQGIKSVISSVLIRPQALINLKFWRKYIHKIVFISKLFPHFCSYCS